MYQKEKKYEVQIADPDILKKEGYNRTGKISDEALPTYSGLYLIGEINLEVQKCKLFFKVKVGKATNLSNRLNKYNTFTTSLELFDYIHIKQKSLSKAEKEFQNLLKEVGKQIGKTEWYIVSERTFYLLKQYGFIGFGKLNI